MERTIITPGAAEKISGGKLTTEGLQAHCDKQYALWKAGKLRYVVYLQVDKADVDAGRYDSLMIDGEPFGFPSYFETMEEVKEWLKPEPGEPILKRRIVELN